MKKFVNDNSIVKQIWSKTDTVLFIFAGAAAEFALNKAVDWLYFTNKLPKDPIGRFFSTISYAQQIIFSDEQQALQALSQIKKIHQNVEKARGSTIPDWAYRDVLFMLIYYSIVAYELLERKLTDAEKEEVYHVFYRVGIALDLTDLPSTYTQWLPCRTQHLRQDLAYSNYTAHLFVRYQEELGITRFKALVEVQKLLVPQEVYQLLGWNVVKWYRPILFCYAPLKNNYFVKELKFRLLPAVFERQLKAIEQ